MGVHQAVELVQLNEKEPWEGCRLGSRETPNPGPSQALIRILCRTINPSDVLSIQGHYLGWRPKTLPAVLGFEGMGVVHQIGGDVSNVAVGQRVFPLSSKTDETGQGLWQEYVLVPATALIRIPDSVSDEVAAQFLVNPWTVVGMLRSLGTPQGEYILQTGAASVLGRMFIQYAHHQGIKTINLVRHNKQKEELKSLGADEVINVVEENVVEKVKEITKEKMAYGAIDCVGGEITRVVVESVRNEGTIFVYGLLGALHAEVGIMDLIFRDVKVHGFWLAKWLTRLHPNELMELSIHVMGLLERKIMLPSVGIKYPLHEFKDAIRKSLEPHRGGKVFLVSP